jgi:tetratricopeptide (TPR) repeat protein
MSHLARAAVLTLCLVATASLPAFAQGKPAAGDVVFLTSREPDRIEAGQRPAPFLARELVRQAVLIAACDEGGLQTRDATLRERAPNDKSRTVGLELFSAASKTPELRYVLRQPAESNSETLWEWKLKAELDDPQTIAKLAELAETLSRGELKAVLARTATLKAVPAARQSAVVPSDAQKGLWEFNELAVFDAVRRIHAEIRQQGESPELLAALVVGYANLGSLTTYHFSPAHKVYFARALLYAERLLHESGGSGWAVWHRAYVRTLVGLHHLAELDVAAAKERQAKSPAKQIVPFWTGAIEAFSQGRLPQIVQYATTPEERRLALYLNLDGVVYSGTGSVIGKAAQDLVAECPDCFRGWDAMLLGAQMNRQRYVTDRAFPQLSQSLRNRLPKSEGLPASIAAHLASARDLDGELKFRAELVAQLDETASTATPGEPSLAALARTIENIEFSRLVRQLQRDAKGQGQAKGDSLDDFIGRTQPLWEHHPDAAFIDTFGRSDAPLREAVTRLARTIDTSALGYNETIAFQPLHREDEAYFATWQTIASAHADPVFVDQMLGLKAGAAGDPAVKEADARYMDMLWKTSSKLPTAVAARVAHDWRHAQHEAAAFEKEYWDDFLVITALTFQYLDHKQLRDAERCARRRTELVPAWFTYGMLATIVKRQGDMVRWEETAKEALSKGFDRIRLCNQLARLYMDRKNWKEASVYADQAAQYAQSGAEIYKTPALRTAARCHEVLGEWKKSEAFIRVLAEHKGAFAHEWMLWCYRTGHGDVGAADEFARKYFESIGGDAPPSTLTKIGAYYLLKKEREKALVVFGKAFDDGHETYAAMHAAVIADALGKADQRDGYLKKIIEDGKKAKPTSIAGVYARLAALMQKVLPTAGVHDFNFKEVDRLLRPSKENRRPGEANLSYFVGAFLKNRGQSDKAGAYFLRCARTQNYQFFNYVLACQALRDLKLPVPAAGGAEAPQENEGDDAAKSANK